MVCNSIVFDDSTKQEMQSLSQNAKEISDAFWKGRIPNYSQQMTIFAQAFGDESFDTIDTIVHAKTKAAESEGGNTPPADSIQILSIQIGSYSDFADTAAN